MNKKDEIRPAGKLRDGFSDGFKPLRALDLSQINSFEDMLILEPGAWGKLWKYVPPC
jgi:hypothetical protein